MGLAVGESQVKMPDKHKRGDLEGEELNKDHLNHAKLLYESSGTKIQSRSSLKPQTVLALHSCPHRMPS